MAQDIAAVTPPATVETATLWERTLAIIPDLIIVGILQGLINFVFGSEQITNAIADPSTTGGFSSYTTTTTVDGVWLWMAAITYFALLEIMFGATAGKGVRGLRVTDLGGHPAGWRAMLTRNVLRIVDWFPGLYLLGALVARFSRRRQRVGDHVAGTIVVPRRAALGPALTSEQRRQRIAILLAVIVTFIAGCALFTYYGRPAIVLSNLAHEARFPGGRVSDYHAGPPQRNGGTVTYPVTYTLASGKPCSGTITLGWDGLPPGWQMTGAESNC